MINGMFNALSGLNTFAKKLQNSSNNVANVSTPGFKSSQVNVSSLKSGGAQVTSTSRTNTPGVIQTTGNPLDMAINGNGFFQVGLPGGGVGFTRFGSFNTGPGGQLVTPDGNPIVPEIAISTGNTGVSIDANGQVSAQVGGAPAVVGQVQLANFNNPAGLSAQGGNLFTETVASGAPIAGNPGTGGLGNVIPGALELSNVDLIKEAVDQIVAKAGFKANVNIIRTADEMLGTLLDIKA